MQCTTINHHVPKKPISQPQTFVPPQLSDHHCGPWRTRQWRWQVHGLQRPERERRQMQERGEEWGQHGEQWLCACLGCISGWFGKDSLGRHEASRPCGWMCVGAATDAGSCRWTPCHRFGRQGHLSCQVSPDLPATQASASDTDPLPHSLISLAQKTSMTLQYVKRLLIQMPCARFHLAPTDPHYSIWIHKKVKL